MVPKMFIAAVRCREGFFGGPAGASTSAHRMQQLTKIAGEQFDSSYVIIQTEATSLPGQESQECTAQHSQQVIGIVCTI